MDAHKKELLNAYKSRPLSGGVYIIRNTQNGRYLLAAETNLSGSKGKFEFSQMTDCCNWHKLSADWKACGRDAFVFEVLDELTQKETQTPDEFRADLAALGELWAEKLDPSHAY